MTAVERSTSSLAPLRSREAKRIVSRLVTFASAAVIALVVLGFVAVTMVENDNAASELRLQIVQLNVARADLATAADEGSGENAQALHDADAALERAQESLRIAASTQSSLPSLLIIVICMAGALAIIGATAYLYLSIVRPFMRLEIFADEVALGNLDLPLVYERSNPFGKFTWAFDNMRKEVKRARSAEREAVEQNKTTIAALSHDIKTPVASIRAYSEALELGLARNDEERADYLQTIMRKCDEVTELTDDLFLHAIADLNRIEVEPIPAAIDGTIRQAIADFDATDTIRIVHLDPATIAHDPKRLAQVIENLIANARKYAQGAQSETVPGLESSAHLIETTGTLRDGTYRIEIRDFGPGMPPADLPFAFDRFYRGSNTGDAPGAGLGLFIVKYLVEQMDGTVHLENTEPGLRVMLDFPTATADSRQASELPLRTS